MLGVRVCVCTEEDAGEEEEERTKAAAGLIAFCTTKTPDFTRIMRLVVVCTFKNPYVPGFSPIGQI